MIKPILGSGYNEHREQFEFAGNIWVRCVIAAILSIYF